MANNLYGYSDYSGPQIIQQKKKEIDSKMMMDQTFNCERANCQAENDHDDDNDVYDHDPLRSGLWMEGDSLAPPCGTSVSTIHKILDLARVSSDDIVYDLGCGDGRVCLEALVQHDCRCCVGVEIELDLIQRFQQFIDQLLQHQKPPPMDDDEAVRKLHQQLQHHQAKEVDADEGDVKSVREQDENHPQSVAPPPRIMALHADLRDVLSALLTRVPSSKNENDDSDTLNKDKSVLSTTGSTDFPHDLPLPSVVFLYLLPEAIALLEPSLISLLQQLPQLRIVMNTWGLVTLPPTQTVQVWEDDTVGVSTLIFIYQHGSSSAPCK